MTDLLLTASLAAVAALFAAIGQAGGAGYVAVLAVAGLGPEAIRPAALLLTLLVAAIGVAHFWRHRLLAWREVWPFAVLGVPGAIAGGMIAIPAADYRVAVGLLMLAAAAQMLRMARGVSEEAAHAPPLLPALLSGGVIGLAAGITGIGGGIFIMPLLLALRWAPTRRAAAIAQVNNLCTAAAGLLGVGLAAPLPAALPWWALAAGGGGLLGAIAGRRLPAPVLRVILALVLLASGAKLLLG